MAVDAVKLAVAAVLDYYYLGCFHASGCPKNSDMQFDIADRNISTNFQAIKDKYTAAGYKQPDIIFWNVCGSNDDYPVSVTDNGTALVSGFSSSILSSFINQKDFSPYTILRNVLDSERLAPIRLLLKDFCLEK